MLSANITVVDVDSLAVDNDSDGVADPGDKIHYTVTVQNTGDASATNLTFQEIINDPNLTLVPGSINVSPLAINDTFSAVANTQLVVGNATPLAGPAATVAGNVLANDTEFLGDTFTISAFDATSANGGSVNLVTSGPNAGSFTYTPAVGFTGADTFTYTIRDKGIDGIAGNADDLISVGTVTINVGAQKVWYVDSNAAAGGNGTSTNPFDSLADVTGATGPDGAGDIIYVRTGAGSYDGGVTLLTNQTLWGENETLIVGGFTLQAAGTDPTLVNSAGNGVTLATGNTLKGFTIGNTTGTDIIGTAVGSLFVTNVSSTGTGGIMTISTSGAINVTLDTATTTNSSTTGISLTGVTGSFTATTGAISGVSGTDVLVSGGTATVSIGSSITSSAGGSVEVTGRGAGANQVTFSGALNITGGTGIFVHDNTAGTVLFSNSSKVVNTGTGTAVNLTTNTGATVNFTNGGLDIDTTSGTGFNATGGGTVSITGTSNSITATTGRAVNISGVTIGASGIGLQSISANGGTNSAITLANTGSGNFTVTGDGTGAAGAQGGNASGGTIQNISGTDAISLNNVGGTVSLSSMSILNITKSTDSTDGLQTLSGVDAIQGSGTIGGLSLVGVKISNTSDMAINGSGTWTGLTINNSLIEKSNRYGVASRGDSNNEGMVVITGLTGTANITNSKFDQGATLLDLMTSTSGHLDVTMTNNVFSNTWKGFNGGVGGVYQVGGYAVRLQTQGSGSLTAIVGDVNQASTALGNQFLNDLYSVYVGHLNSADTGLIKVLLSENTFKVTTHLSPTGAPIFSIPYGTVLLAPRGVGNMDATVSNNTFDQTFDTAGLAGSLSIAAEGGTNNQVKVTGNNFINPWDRAIEMRSNNGAVLTALVSGNTYASTTAGGAGTDSTAFTGPFDSNRFWTLNNSTMNLTWQNETVSTNQSASRALIQTSNASDVMNVFLNNLSVPNGYSFASNSVINVFRNGSVSGTIAGILQDNNVKGGGGVATTTPPSVTTSGTVQGSNTPVTAPSFTIPLLFSPTIPDAGTDTTDPADQPAADQPDDSPLPTDPTAGTTPIVDDGVLTQAELDTLVAAAIARWEATGLTPEQAAALHSVQFVVEDLPPGYLGEATPGVVIIDRNASGNSWFIDSSPDDDSEFAGIGSDLHATASGGAAGRVDALSVIMHELGHQLGLSDTYASADSASVMYGWLQQGERRLPTDGQAVGADPNYLVWEDGPDFLFGSMSLGTLPAGYSVTIVYDATVNNITNGIAPIVKSQIRVQGDGGINVLSDDPSIAGAANPTETPIDAITIGNLVYLDADASGTFNAGDTGINGVTVNLYVDVNTNGVLDAGDGAAIATTTTAGGGLYSFGVLPGDYLVEIAASNFQSGGALEGKFSTGGSAIDPDNNVDNDDNGVNNANPAVNGISSQAITVAYNAEPTADGTGKFDINNTVDFGFIANIPPVLTTAGNITYTENDPPTAIDTGITVSDANNATLASATITITNFVAGQDVLSFTNDGLTMGNIAISTNVGGVLTLTSAGNTATVAEWQAALRAVKYSNTSDNPNTTARSVNFVVNDGTDPSNTLASTINITATNDGPTLATSGNITYTENDPPTAIDTGITVSDPDSTTLASATITITNFVAGQDVLSFTNDGLTMGNIAISTNVGGVLTLTSAGSTATLVQWQAALRAVQYSNTSDNPNTTARSVDFVANDGTDPGNTLTSTINITATNDVPVLAVSGNITYTENDPATAIDTGITVSDIDSTTLASATITITNFVAGQDVLSFTNDGLTMGNIAVSTNVGGVLTLTSAGNTATLVQWQAALRAVNYSNTSDNPNTTARSVDFVVNDGTDPSNTLTSTINITATNDAPLLAVSGNITYTENDPATAIDTGITVSDVDSTTLASATITITNFVAGQDVLSFTNDGLTMGNIAISTNVGGVLTLTSSGNTATVAEWQAALRAVKYSNTSDNPNTTARSVDFIVNDGTDPSNTLTSTINITATNDAPVLANIETSPLPYAPNAPAVNVTSTLTLTDIDSTNITGATITITGYQVGDSLQFTNTPNITGVFAAGTLTLTGTDTVANYEAALRSITYVSTTSSPAARTVNFQVTDGTDPSNIQSRTVGGYAQLVGTTLNVYGTPQVNNIQVAEDTSLDITVDGVLSQFTPAAVTAINIYGYDGDDTILINSLNTGTALTAYGGNGNDTIKVNSGVLQGVTLDGGDNNDLLIGGSGNDTLIGGLGSDWLNGGDGSDSLTGGVGSDVYAFNDTLTNQTDTVVELNGEGTDQLNFSAMTTAVTVNLTSDTALATMSHRIVKTGGAGQALVIENVLGGSGNDFITGNAGHNYLAGNDGNDTLNGAEGNDELVGGQGNDLLKGGTEDDVLIGGIGDDYLKGEAGNDYLDGGDGFNTLAGGTNDDVYRFGAATVNQIDTVVELVGEGIDTLDFSALTTAVNVNLTSDTATATMDHRIVQTGVGQSANLENVIGGSGNDQITGNAANNLLSGLGGNDTILGGAGNDILLGGLGNDVLKGISGRNILIGGAGGDVLQGGTDDDLIISGSSTFETNPPILQALLAEWASANAYQVRVDHLLGNAGGGANTSFILSPSTVTNDVDADYLTGNAGRDWFLANSLQDVINDQQIDEVFTHIDTWV